jgi:hypothetical protein
MMWLGSITEMKITYREAVLFVLREAGHPLTTREIIDSVIASGLVIPGGKTPDATMSALLYRTLKADSELMKMEEPGPWRAKRGTVRWALKSWSETE